MFELIAANTDYLKQTDITISGEICIISNDYLVSIYWLAISGLIGHIELWIIIISILTNSIGKLIIKNNNKLLGIISLILSKIAIITEIIFIAILLNNFKNTYEEYYILFDGWKVAGYC